MGELFVRRPVVAMVISILILLLGLVAMQGLPVAQYPEITPPEILVNATYTGANAVDVEQSVATPIEQQVNGVEEMIYMRSINASDGTLQLRVAFEVGADLDMSNVLVQNRVSIAQPSLPEEVKRLGVSVKKSLAFPLLVVSLSSPEGTYDSDFLSNYASININDALARVRGVGQVNVFGGSDYAMRVWVRPDRLASLGLTVADLSRALREQNVIAPAGQIGGPPAPPGTDLTWTVGTQGRLTTVEEFADVIVRSNPDGSQVRLGDVARIELGTQRYDQLGRLNGKPAAVIAIYQSPGTNALAIVEELRATLADLATRFPPDMVHEVSLDTTLAVQEGIDEIVVTLFQVIALVILVVFVFLQSWRATLIPLLTVPVALMGTFIVFPLLGFSINVLSLLGLVLAVGTVVDDAIVVVEAVTQHVESGLSPREATIRAMKEVSGPVVATTLILVAVFVPVAFMGGITGRLYQQFAITIAISVVFSSINALSLSPALASKLLRPAGAMRGPLGAFFRAYNRGFERLSAAYGRLVGGLTRRALLGVGAVVLLALAVVPVVEALPAGFVPEEDQGYLLVNVQLPDAASIQRTDEVCRQVEEILGSTEEIASYVTVAGYSMITQATASNYGFFFVSLDPWDQREGLASSAFGLLRRLNARFATEIPQAIVFAFGPPAIPGLGTGSGFSVMLQDRGGNDPLYLQEQTQRFVAAAVRRPEIGRAFSAFSASVPQLFVDVDRDKALKLGVSLSDLNTVLGAGLGGSYVNDFNRFGRLYKVYVQAEPEYRTDPALLGQFFVRSAQGAMVPLSTLVDVRQTLGPAFTNRFNLYRAAEVTGAPAPGHSSAQALAALEEVAREVLPPDVGHAWNAMSYQEQQASGSGAIVFLFGLVCVFLILAAQYESWSLPFAVLLGTPFAAFGAFFGIWAMRFASPIFENNVFAQIALVMLIGMAAKNAILIVEFAKERRDRGVPALEAAIEAARQRFRPILMTAFSFILGVLPLLVATGAGSLARRVMGVASFSGMLFATVLGVLFVPTLFLVVDRLAGGRGRAPAAQEAEA